MNFINKIAGVGVTLTVAIVAAAVLLLGSPAQTADAGQLASVSLACSPDTRAATSTNTVSCTFRFDEASTYSAAETVDGVSVTLTTVLGTWAANGQKSITFDCGNVGSTSADSCDASTLSFVLNTGTTVGTNTVVISAGTAVDTFAVSFTTPTGSGAADSIGPFSTTNISIGYATTGYAPLITKTNYMVRVKDADGLGLNSVLVEFTTDFGVLDSFGADCTGTLGSTVTGSSTTISGFAGVAGATLCGKSTAGVGLTATVTGKVVTKPTLTQSGSITISKKPASADIVATVSGTTISVEVFKDGIPAPDDTDITFQVIPSTDAALVTGCVSLHDGKASTEIAVAAGKTVNVLIAAAENDVKCDGSTSRTYGSTQIQVTAAGAAAPAPSTGAAATATQPPAGGASQVVMTQGSLTVFLAANTWVISVTFFDVAAQKTLFCHIEGAPAFAVDTCTLSAGSILGLTSR